MLKRPAAAVSLCFIVFTVLVAIFAYLIAPDSTPAANRMVIELGARPPGFSIDILSIPKPVQNTGNEHSSKWIAGKPSNYQSLPIINHYFKGDNLYVVHYIDDGLQDTLVYKASILCGNSIHTQSISEQIKYINDNLIKREKFWLGTDRYGRDILSRLIIGSRISIGVGIVAVLLSVFIGVALGCFAGYFRGWVDDTVMFIINILWAIPTILLVFSITLTIGKGFWQIFVAIGLTMWVGAARLVRGQVMVVREMEFVTAARALGASDMRIIFRHILPNIAGPVMVIAAANFATAILLEAGLSFLGIGVQAPQPSWGLMIKEHYNFLISGQPMAAIIPGLAIMVLVYSFNILGNALRDVIDVRQ